MLSIQNIQRTFDGTPVLRGIDLEVGSGEIVCLLGPSGCGKTTLLRIIAGLETHDTGTLLWKGEALDSVPVHRRGFGLMFQDFALFPHMNVAANIQFGLEMQRISSSEQRRRVEEVLKLVNLEGFEDRDISQLSGGEKQRVALARSLAPNPQLLMLDEPMGSLDAALRDELVSELHQIIKSLGLTAIYVTHDQKEAFAIADRIAVMNAGRIEQVDRPQQVYQHPATGFVARFLGFQNIIPVTENRGGRVKTELGEFTISGTSKSLLIHPASLSLQPSPNGIHFPATVIDVVFQGELSHLRVQHASGIKLSLAVQNIQAVPHLNDDIQVWIDPAGIVPLRE